MRQEFLRNRIAVCSHLMKPMCGIVIMHYGVPYAISAYDSIQRSLEINYQILNKRWSQDRQRRVPSCMSASRRASGKFPRKVSELLYFAQRLVVGGDNAYPIAPSGRGTEVAIPAPTRNRLGALPPHEGSNPSLSANQYFWYSRLDPAVAKILGLSGQRKLWSYPSGFAAGDRCHH